LILTVNINAKNVCIMKTLRSFLFFVLMSGVFATGLKAEVTWEKVTSGTTSRFWDVAYVNETTAIAVGVGGMIMKSTDGGATWSTVTHDLTTQDLYVVHFATDQVGFIGGLSATVLKTVDGGATWTNISANLPEIITTYAQLPTQAINDFYFLDANNGFATGYNGIILKTTDSGASWTFHGALGAGTFRSICFVNATTGFIVAHGKMVKKTVDGGENWTTWTSEETIFNHFFETRFFNETTGVAIGDGGSIFRTTDTGANWTRVVIDPAPTGQLWGLTVVSPTIAYASGQLGQIYKTTDAGATWTKEDIGNNTSIFRGMSNIGENKVLAVGDAGEIYKLISSTNALTNPTLSASMQLYPNPVDHFMMVKTDASIQKVVILDVTGKSVMIHQTDAPVLNVKMLNNGIYFAHIYTSEGLAVKKFIKQ
jgi:photosystem II stability/assembly factor-like uncharacterized protein